MRHKKTIIFLKKHRKVFDENDRNIFIAEDGIPPLPEWFLQIRGEKKRKNNQTWVMRFRPALIVCAAIIIFFIATPPGRVLAKNFYNLIINWYDTYVTMQIEDPSHDIDKSAESAEQLFYTYDELESIYQGTYYYVPDRRLSYIQFSQTEAGGDVFLVYEYDDGNLAISNRTEAAGSGNAVTAGSGNTAKIDGYMLNDGTEVFGYFDINDNEGSVMGANGDHVVSIMGSAENIESFYELLDSIEKK